MAGRCPHLPPKASFPRKPAIRLWPAFGGSGGNPEKLLGGNSDEDTPVPIPNTEVKPVYVDGTARQGGWESRKPPGLNKTPNHESGWGGFFYSGVHSKIYLIRTTQFINLLVGILTNHC